MSLKFLHYSSKEYPDAANSVCSAAVTVNISAAVEINQSKR